jgi:hypothetical protein
VAQVVTNGIDDNLRNLTAGRSIEKSNFTPILKTLKSRKLTPDLGKGPFHKTPSTECRRSKAARAEGIGINCRTQCDGTDFDF